MFISIKTMPYNNYKDFARIRIVPSSSNFNEWIPLGNYGINMTPETCKLICHPPSQGQLNKFFFSFQIFCLKRLVY